MHVQPADMDTHTWTRMDTHMDTHWHTHGHTLTHTWTHTDAHGRLDTTVYARVAVCGLHRAPHAEIWVWQPQANFSLDPKNIAVKLWILTWFIWENVMILFEIKCVIVVWSSNFFAKLNVWSSVWLSFLTFQNPPSPHPRVFFKCVTCDRGVQTPPPSPGRFHFWWAHLFEAFPKGTRPKGVPITKFF